MRKKIFRKQRRISKRKLVNAVALFEDNVDEIVEKIEIQGDMSYIINDQWRVSLSNNTVYKIYPDPEW